MSKFEKVTYVNVWAGVIYHVFTFSVRANSDKRIGIGKL